MALTNPYTKPNPLAKPLYSTKPVTAGGVTVETKKPILVEPTGLALPKPEQQQTPVESAGFWARKSNKQKAMFIGVGLIAVIAIVAFTNKK